MSNMKKFLLAGAVFLATGAGTYFLIQEKGMDLFEDPSTAAVSGAITPFDLYGAAAKTGSPFVKVIIEHGVYVYFVNYENSGFSPKDFKIPAGSSAHFVNKSDKALRVYSKNQNTPYHVLNQSLSIKKGGIYKFNFTTKGFWEFYNLNNPNDTGSITVY